jgi:uncharacterized RDD family membrane protein YckC
MTPEYTTENPDLLILENEYVRASGGKRFANYIIDVIVFYILILGVGVLLAIIAPDSLDALADDSPGVDLADRLITLALYGLYMGIIEAIFKGKSLGKLITRTRAVNLDGSRISTQTAFARGFSKAVPFCAFSALGTPCNPWQDKWTNSMVIDETRR